MSDDDADLDEAAEPPEGRRGNDVADAVDDGEALDAPPRARPDETGSALRRFYFYAVWVIAVPSALAVAAVSALQSGQYEQAGVVRDAIRDQKIPAAILFFAVAAMITYRFRYLLPLAKGAGILPREDLPAELRGRFDDAGHLLEEARGILERIGGQGGLSKKSRRAVHDALDDLEDAMLAPTLDPEGFREALERAETLVAKHLSRWRKSELREYAESIGVAVLVAVLLRFFVIEAFKIPSGSMIPTLMIGDHIFVAKYAYGPLIPHTGTRLFNSMPPERGDVMVFKFPENPEQDFIKRTVALPGDQLEVIDGRPILNGLLIPHCYVGRIDMPHGVRGHLYLEHMGAKSYLTMFDTKPGHPKIKCRSNVDCGGARACRSGICGFLQGPYNVAEGQAWVMGDNRNNSHDSRSWNGGLGAGVPFANIKGRATVVWWSWAQRGGPAWDRLFVDVMGNPKLPPGAPSEVLRGLAKCQRDRPPVSETTPPPPKRRR